MKIGIAIASILLAMTAATYSEAASAQACGSWSCPPGPIYPGDGDTQRENNLPGYASSGVMVYGTECTASYDEKYAAIIRELQTWVPYYRADLINNYRFMTFGFSGQLTEGGEVWEIIPQGESLPLMYPTDSPHTCAYK
ncbi:hypothetical protein [Stenotrophomonas sp.]|uniref:hypothetical protein n=1 Tax=Stenotrophomonas sp. TaxID=69392 RepID=UPI0028AF82AE|nr:hypothetical protein [Stenotrophomonas sp.]